MKRLPYSRQVIEEDDIEAVAAVLRSDWLTTGPAVREFEEQFAARVGARFAVSFCNGTAALHAAHYALGIGPGDETIVPSNTFLASANGAAYVGAIPVFADIRRDTYCMDETAWERRITPGTRLVTPVHFAGHPCDMKTIHAIATKHDLKVLEDAAHALGATYHGEPVGSCRYSQATISSFHPVKHIATGEGGMVTTNDQETFERLAMFRNHGTWRTPDKMDRNEGPWWYEMHELGYNFRLSDIHAALGSSQLKKLDRFVARRREIAALYRKLMAGKPFVVGLQEEQEGCENSYHLVIALLDYEHSGVSRKDLMEWLSTLGIFTQVHYIPVNRHPYYVRTRPGEQESTPNADWYYAHTLSIPVFPTMTDEDVQFVAHQILSALSGKPLVPGQAFEGQERNG